MLKRLFDIFFSFTGIIILLPLLIFISLAIKLSSKGPIFYRGTRVGRRGKLFKIYKFRSMVVNAEKMGNLSTAENDSRITKVGRFIRKYKFDEFPQLINILKGEMSLVGPRPEVKKYVRFYNEEEKIALSVRPGLTDLASLEFMDMGKSVGDENAEKEYLNNIMPEKNRLRMEYVRRHSFWIDFKIIVQTVIKIFRSYAEKK